MREMGQNQRKTGIRTAQSTTLKTSARSRAKGSRWKMPSISKNALRTGVSIFFIIVIAGALAYYQPRNNDSKELGDTTRGLGEIISSSLERTTEPQTFSLKFTEGYHGGQSILTPQSHDLVMASLFHGCAIDVPDNCGPELKKAFATFDEETKAKLAGKTNMQVQNYIIVKRGDAKELVIDQFNPNFERLSKTNYATVDGKMLIDLEKNDFPLIFITDKTLKFGDNRIYENGIAVIYEEEEGAPFGAVTASSSIDDFKFSQTQQLLAPSKAAVLIQQNQKGAGQPLPDRYGKFGAALNGNTFSYWLEGQQKLPQKATITFKGFDTETQGRIIQADLIRSNSNEKLAGVQKARSGTDYIVQLPQLEAGGSYSMKIKFLGEKEISYNYSFTMMQEFSLLSSTQNSARVGSYQYGESTSSNSMRLCFSQPLDRKQFEQSLDEGVGKGRYFVRRNEVHYRGNHQTVGQTCATVAFYVDPTTNSNFKLKGIKSLLGETTDADISLPAHTLMPRDKYAKIVGTPVTILPIKDKKRVQVLLKNEKQATLYYRSCNMQDESIGGLLGRLSEPRNNYHRSYLLQKFITCDYTRSREIKVNDFKRRKENLVEFSYDELFGDEQPSAVEVGLQPFENKRGNVILTTNIGVLAKYARNTAHVWAHSLDKGAALTDVAYTMVYEHKGKMVSKKGSFDKYLEFEFPEDIAFGFLIVSKGTDRTYVSLPKEYVYHQESSTDFSNSFAINLREIGGAAYRGNPAMHRLFGFTDRGLYKAGDDVFVSGWLRKPGPSVAPKGTLNIELRSPKGEIVGTQTFKSLDEFGGFKAKFTLGKEAPLGSYALNYTFNPDGMTQRRDDGSGPQASHFYGYFQVQEFKKANVDLDAKIITKDDKPHLRISPSYYFGSDLDAYDVKMQYSLQSRRNTIYDWEHCGSSRCDNPMYYNHADAFRSQNSGGFLQVDNYAAKYLDLSLDAPTTSVSNLTVNTTLVDRATKEVVQSMIQEEILPKYLVGFESRPYQRHNQKDGKFTLKGQIRELKGSDQELLENYGSTQKKQSLKLKIFYKPFHNQQELGPDGEYYYSYEGRFDLQKEQDLSPNGGGTFSERIDFEEPGTYILQTLHPDGYQNSMRLYVYNTDTNSTHYGELSNNYVLKVQTNDREYEPGDKIDVNIDPYIVGATAVITVEKDGVILHREQQVLKGRPIRLTAEKSRFPNAHVSVAQIVGADKNTKISENRHEPRFFIGYSNMRLSPTALGIDFDIKLTDMNGKKQPYYQPGQKVKLRIQTKDYEGNALKSRLTVGIVDKALIDIFDIAKNPLRAIYFNSTPGFHVMANYKLLFKALKVFSSEGQKGGGGGMDRGGVGDLSPRKIFRDVAFWRGGEITDDNGVAEFTVTLPDNLTTWVVETTAVGKEGEMATDRHYFKVNKDVIANAFLPRFISPYSTIRVPVSVIINKEGVKDVGLIATMTLNGREYDLPIKTDGDDRYFDLSIDQIPLDDVLESEVLTILLVAKGQDAIEYKLPIRKENMFISKFDSHVGDKYKNALDLNGKAEVAQITASVSKLPVIQLSNAVSYLLRYPYGCTEQLLSSMYPTLVAKDLHEKGLLSRGLISGDKVNYQGQFNDIQVVLDDTLEKIYRNQMDDGLFAYWPGSPEPNMHLSIYVYHVLHYIKNLGYDVNDEVLEKLTRSLKNFPDKTTHMYYLLQRAMVDQTVSVSQVDSILASDSSYQNMVMAYTIKAYLGTNDSDLYKGLTRKQKAYERSYSYAPYYNGTVLKTFLIRGLILNDQDDEALELVKDLIDQVDDTSRRGWSTQSNVQSIRALGDFMSHYEDEDVDRSYTLEIAGEKFKGDLSDKFTAEHKVTKKNIKDLATNFEGNSSLFVTIEVDYVPAGLSSLEESLNNVSKLSYKDTTIDTFNESLVGTITTHTAQFGIENDARQLAVSINIPPNSFIMNPIEEETECYYDCYEEFAGGPSNEKQKLSFTRRNDTSKWYSCTPTHHEVRFDRLFLYYDNLPSGALCDVTFSTMKTHEANIKLLTTELFEMYDTNVRGTSYLK